MESELGAIHAGAKVTQLDAVNVGAKPSCHLADDAELTLTWQHLGAVTISAKLGAIVIAPSLAQQTCYHVYHFLS
jgi:hypothetical protein